MAGLEVVRILRLPSPDRLQAGENRRAVARQETLARE